jgi:hypothetical protein
MIKMPIDLKISRIFRDKADQIDVRLIQKCLDYTPFEQSVVHQTCGQLLKVDTNLLLGNAIKEENRSITPCKDRQIKAEERVLLEDEIEDNDFLPAIPPKLPDNELNEYPSWPNQISGIESFASELMLVENDEVGMNLMKEFEQLWAFWNSDYNTNFRSDRIRELVANRQ